jgi:DNA-binding MarR family transcriptional regulator
MTSDDGYYRRLERELAVMMRVNAATTREIAAEIHPGLDVASMSTLTRIAETAPARASDMAEFFGVDKAAISRQVQGLERLGLIERANDPADGRAQTLQLTEAGLSQVTRVTSARIHRFRALLADWTQQDIDDLGRLLGRLNRLLSPPVTETQVARLLGQPANTTR